MDNHSRARRGRAPRPARSATERFERAYRRCDAALRQPTVPDLTAAQRAALRVVAREQVSLGGLAERLDLPKSTTSVLVKRLERRGLLRRRRDSEDERRLAIVITPKGRRRVADDRVLDSTRLTAALRALPRSARAKLLDGLERVADAAERRAAVSRR